MKNLLLAIAFFCTVSSVAVAGSGTIAAAATASARQILTALNLNEVQYLKVRSIETNRLSEISQVEVAFSGAELTERVAAINTKYTTEIVSILSADQKQKFATFKKEQAAQQVVNAQ